MQAPPKYWVMGSNFRVLIIQFLDAHNFDVRSVKKSCIHIVHPDGRITFTSTFNLFCGMEKKSPAGVSHGKP